uniref:BHLH domain-containing protein n=1 Tax=Strigamia maritima TaxID=126957 RepID=T1IMH2_STRMM
MSDEDSDIYMQSDDDVDANSEHSGYSGYSGGAYETQGSKAEKRAHHNALERKRRDHIKDSFTDLLNAIPPLQGEKMKTASRAMILKRARDYILSMNAKNSNHQQEIDDLKRQISHLETQRNLSK